MAPKRTKQAATGRRRTKCQQAVCHLALSILWADAVQGSGLRDLQIIVRPKFSALNWPEADPRHAPIQSLDLESGRVLHLLGVTEVYPWIMPLVLFQAVRTGMVN